MMKYSIVQESNCNEGHNSHSNNQVAPTVLPGDVNENGTYNLMDVVAHFVELSNYLEGQLQADVDIKMEGEVNLLDGRQLN